MGNPEKLTTPATQDIRRKQTKQQQQKTLRNMCWKPL